MVIKAKVYSFTALPMRSGMPLVAITTAANGDAHAASLTDEALKFD